MLLAGVSQAPCMFERLCRSRMSIVYSNDIGFYMSFHLQTSSRVWVRCLSMIPDLEM